MPTYEYRCKDCGHQFDAVQSFTDDALTECPSCDGSLRKVFGNVGISFKGSGFYKTDSRATNGASAKDDVKANGSEPSASKSESGGSSDSGSKSDSGSSDSGSKGDSGSAGSGSKSDSSKKVPAATTSSSSSSAARD